MAHAIVLSPPSELINPALAPNHRRAPAILQRSDEDFLPAVLESLRDEAGRRSLLGSRAGARTNRQVLKLFQPVQRQFHVALFEAYCDQPGHPRLDPAKVAAAGLVIRRLRRGAGSTHYEGWMRMGGRLRGWLKTDLLGTAEADPASRLRLARKATGVADLDRALSALVSKADSRLFEEQVVPMFAAPPEICHAAGRTLFYGILPTASSEIAEGPVTLADSLGEAAMPFGPNDAEFRKHLVDGLQGKEMRLPLAGETMNAAWFEAVEMTGDEKPRGLSDAHWSILKNPAGSSAIAMRRFIALLHQLALEFDAFGDSAESKALLKVLAEIDLVMKLKRGEKHHRTVPADRFLVQANALLLEHAAGAARPEMPEKWPTLGDALKNRLLHALSVAVQKRFAEMKGAPGRFDEPGAQYAIRAFVREKPDGACPGRIHWSDYSEPFVIAAWYEGGGAPPIQITLPEVGDLKSIKPNVAFVVPPSLQGLVSGNPKDMLDGKGSLGSGGLAWICGFNIPIITLCAFIVLNIFLSLFNLFFWWLPFIKVCIPFPKKAD